MFSAATRPNANRSADRRERKSPTPQYQQQIALLKAQVEKLSGENNGAASTEGEEVKNSHMKHSYTRKFIEGFY